MKLFVILQVTLISSCYTIIFLVSAVKHVDATSEVVRELNIEHDDILRDYLGYYGKFIPEQMENWCPTNCNNGNQIFVNPHYSAYCSCIEKEGSWQTEKHYCAENEIFNKTESGCHRIPGNGCPTCVMKGHNCPHNDTGIIKHPDNKLFKNYLICSSDMVIVGECAEMHHFDDSKKSCVRMNITNTDLVESDCPIVEKIECEEPGIFPVNFKEKVSPSCKNCFYICSLKTEDKFELKISCEVLSEYENSYRIDNEFEKTAHSGGTPTESAVANFEGSENIQSGEATRDETPEYDPELFEINEFGEIPTEYTVHNIKDSEIIQSGGATSNKTPTEIPEDDTDFSESGEYEKTAATGKTQIEYPTVNIEGSETIQSGKATGNETPIENPEDGGTLTEDDLIDQIEDAESSQSKETTHNDERPTETPQDDTEYSESIYSGEAPRDETPEDDSELFEIDKFGEIPTEYPIVNFEGSETIQSGDAAGNETPTEYPEDGGTLTEDDLIDQIEDDPELFEIEEFGEIPTEYPIVNIEGSEPIQSGDATGNETPTETPEHGGTLTEDDLIDQIEDAEGSQSKETTHNDERPTENPQDDTEIPESIHSREETRDENPEYDPELFETDEFGEIPTEYQIVNIEGSEPIQSGDATGNETPTETPEDGGTLTEDDLIDQIEDAEGSQSKETTHNDERPAENPQDDTEIPESIHSREETRDENPEYDPELLKIDEFGKIPTEYPMVNSESSETIQSGDATGDETPTETPEDGGTQTEDDLIDQIEDDPELFEIEEFGEIPTEYPIVNIEGSEPIQSGDATGTETPTETPEDGGTLTEDDLIDQIEDAEGSHSKETTHNDERPTENPQDDTEIPESIHSREETRDEKPEYDPELFEIDEFGKIPTEYPMGNIESSETIQSGDATGNETPTETPEDGGTLTEDDLIDQIEDAEGSQSKETAHNDERPTENPQDDTEIPESIHSREETRDENPEYDAELFKIDEFGKIPTEYPMVNIESSETIQSGDATGNETPTETPENGGTLTEDDLIDQTEDDPELFEIDEFSEIPTEYPTVNFEGSEPIQSGDATGNETPTETPEDGGTLTEDDLIEQIQDAEGSQSKETTHNDERPTENPQDDTEIPESIHSREETRDEKPEYDPELFEIDEFGKIPTEYPMSNIESSETIQSGDATGNETPTETPEDGGTLTEDDLIDQIEDDPELFEIDEFGEIPTEYPIVNIEGSEPIQSGDATGNETTTETPEDGGTLTEDDLIDQIEDAEDSQSKETTHNDERPTENPQDDTEIAESIHSREETRDENPEYDPELFKIDEFGKIPTEYPMVNSESSETIQSGDATGNETPTETPEDGGTLTEDDLIHQIEDDPELFEIDEFGEIPTEYPTVNFEGSEPIQSGDATGNETPTETPEDGGTLTEDDLIEQIEDAEGSQSKETTHNDERPTENPQDDTEIPESIHSREETRDEKPEYDHELFEIDEFGKIPTEYPMGNIESSETIQSGDATGNETPTETPEDGGTLTEDDLIDQIEDDPELFEIDEFGEIPTEYPIVNIEGSEPIQSGDATGNKTPTETPEDGGTLTEDDLIDQIEDGEGSQSKETTHNDERPTENTQDDTEIPESIHSREETRDENPEYDPELFKIDEFGKIPTEYPMVNSESSETIQSGDATGNETPTETPEDGGTLTEDDLIDQIEDDPELFEIDEFGEIPTEYPTVNFEGSEPIQSGDATGNETPTETPEDGGKLTEDDLIDQIEDAEGSQSKETTHNDERPTENPQDDTEIPESIHSREETRDEKPEYDPELFEIDEFGKIPTEYPMGNIESSETIQSGDATGNETPTEASKDGGTLTEDDLIDQIEDAEGSQSKETAHNDERPTENPQDDTEIPESIHSREETRDENPEYDPELFKIDEFGEIPTEYPTVNFEGSEPIQSGDATGNETPTETPEDGGKLTEDDLIDQIEDAEGSQSKETTHNDERPTENPQDDTEIPESIHSREETRDAKPEYDPELFEIAEFGEIPTEYPIVNSESSETIQSGDATGNETPTETPEDGGTLTEDDLIDQIEDDPELFEIDEFGEIPTEYPTVNFEGSEPIQSGDATGNETPTETPEDGGTLTEDDLINQTEDAKGSQSKETTHNDERPTENPQDDTEIPESIHSREETRDENPEYDPDLFKIDEFGKIPTEYPMVNSESSETIQSGDATGNETPTETTEGGGTLTEDDLIDQIEDDPEHFEIDEFGEIPTEYPIVNIEGSEPIQSGDATGTETPTETPEDGGTLTEDDLIDQIEDAEGSQSKETTHNDEIPTENPQNDTEIPESIHSREETRDEKPEYDPELFEIDEFGKIPTEYPMVNIESSETIQSGDATGNKTPTETPEDGGTLTEDDLIDQIEDDPELFEIDEFGEIPTEYPIVNIEGSEPIQSGDATGNETPTETPEDGGTLTEDDMIDQIEDAEGSQSKETTHNDELPAENPQDDTEIPESIHSREETRDEKPEYDPELFEIDEFGEIPTEYPIVNIEGSEPIQSGDATGNETPTETPEDGGTLTEDDLIDQIEDAEGSQSKETTHNDELPAENPQDDTEIPESIHSREETRDEKPEYDPELFEIAEFGEIPTEYPIVNIESSETIQSGKTGNETPTETPEDGGTLTEDDLIDQIEDAEGSQSKETSHNDERTAENPQDDTEIPESIHSREETRDENPEYDPELSKIDEFGKIPTEYPVDNTEDSERIPSGEATSNETPTETLEDSGTLTEHLVDKIKDSKISQSEETTDNDETPNNNPEGDIETPESNQSEDTPQNGGPPTKTPEDDNETFEPKAERGRLCHSSPDQPCTKEGFFRLNHSCTQHYECYFSKKCGKIISSGIYECPKCLKFNVRKSRCDLPQYVPECTIHEENYQKYQNHILFRPVKLCSGPGIFPDPSYENKYYECIDILGENIFYLTSVNCPIKNRFNPNTGICELNYSNTHHQNNNVLGECNGNSYAFHRYSCQKLFKCVDNQKPVELECLDGYIFNGKVCQLISLTSYCDWDVLKELLYKKTKE